MGTGEQEEKRSRILDAAEHVFARRGFHGARVTDIARRAGVADGTIYLYFKNKDDLLVSLFEDRMSRVNAMLLKTLEQTQGARARIERFLAEYLSLADERPSLAEVMSIELRATSKFMKEYKNVKFLQFLGLVGRVVEEGQQEGAIRTDVQPELVARALFGAVDELLVRFVMARRKPSDIKEASRQLFAVFWSGLEQRRDAP